jgi:hypothetical protein
LLPAQASSVCSERVFSSAKHTTTLQRNRSSTKLIEMLQILKFGFKQEALSSADDWVMTADDLRAALLVEENEE